MQWKLELIVVPVADQDRAKAFYVDLLGWELIVDHRAGDFRVVQACPPGSRCAIALMPGGERSGQLSGVHLIVEDADAARAEMVARGAEPSPTFHFDEGREQPGPDPERRDYNTFFTFADPDGNGWLVQEVRSAGAA